MAGGPSHLETVRLQAGADKTRRPAVSRIVHQGPAARAASEHGAQSARAVRQIRKVRHSRARRSPTLFPHIARMADDICIIRSMTTEQINHDPAQAFMNSGSILKGRPSMGSWLVYGLGAESDDCRVSSSLFRKARPAQQPVSARQWSSGFLPCRSRASSSSRRATRCITSAIPTASASHAAAGHG